MHHHLSYLYALFGLFLIGCGLLSVFFLGWKAKTALVSGGMSGFIALTAGHFLNLDHAWALYLGTAETAILTGVFSWRASAAFLKMTQLLQTQEKAAIHQKSIAFLIIATMLIIALVVLILSVTFFTGALASIEHESVL